MKIRVCVSGATGAVGRALVEAIIDSADLELVGATSRKNAGNNLGQLIGKDNCNLLVSGSLEEALKVTTDVVVDYTNATAVKHNVLVALKAGVPVVIGSSGLTEDDYSEIGQLAEQKTIGVFAGGNVSITAVLMQYFAKIAARHVPQWEIIDYCKADKIDAPSGTSRELAHKISQIAKPVLNVPIEKTFGEKNARGASIEGSQVHSVRLPSFFSSAEVIFALPGERLSIRHDAVDNAKPYVYGKLLAVRKISSIKGLVRGMEHLLDLSA